MNVVALKRKLTTILIVDIAGYSRLMGRDEEGTHARFLALRAQLLEPRIRSHEGRIVKGTGDGLLAEFPSVVQAVRSALAIQQDVAAQNADVPGDERMAVRIGINLGDVIVEPDDIYGDGVNVAARLEGLARPGGIVVSRAVRDHVCEKLPIGFDDLGPQRVKNMDRPVHAFRIRLTEREDAEPGSAGRAWRRLDLRILAFCVAAAAGGLAWAFTSPLTSSAVSLTSAKPSPPNPSPLSIVVLPFANIGGDPRREYLADGITESLTTDLSRALPGSFVVARGTAFTYKGKPIDGAQIGRDLNVRYALAGSVLADNDRMRINAQLIDTATNAEIWAERFDKGLGDVLLVQDQIVGRLSRAVGLSVIDVEARRSERSANPTAIDLVMRGKAIANRPTSQDTMTAARGLFQQALQHDPDNVDALAGVAMTHVFEVLNSYHADGRRERLQEAEVLLRRAIALGPRHLVALKTRAALLRAQGRFDDAINASLGIIAQNPGEPWAYKEVGLSALYLGRTQEALDWFEKADQIGPRDPSRWLWLGAIGRVQLFRGHDQDAIRYLRMAADANPKDSRSYALLAAAFALSGSPDEAASALAECLRLQPGLTIRRMSESWSVPLQAASDEYLRGHDRIREGLRKAGMRDE